MINWKEISSLHVISKLEQILSRWFGVELYYTDSHYKVRSSHLDKDFEHKNWFFKSQMSTPHGYDHLTQDIERVSDQLWESGAASMPYDSFFPYVKGQVAKVELEGEIQGCVFAYPFMMDTSSKKEFKALHTSMVENGSSPEDADAAIERMKKMSPTMMEYLKELVELVAEEITTFHTEISKREERIQELNSELGDKYRYHSMIGKSKKMQQIYSLLQRISASESSVLIQGENGTGKELVAKAIHYYSSRKDNVFLAVNCSAFNDNLLDSELFGHVKGAFTGAIRDKKGLFEQAHGGTLFLDEIGDTSPTMQVKLLRVLQEGTYLPVGSTSPKKCDVRVLTATNKNLKELMQKGDFREDFYYRINVINVNLPPLRDRAEDISILMDHFLNKKCAEGGMPVKTISKKCMEKMLDYPWPGNVRELENEVERLVVLAGQDKTILPEFLSPRILEYGEDPEVAGRGINTAGSLKDALEELEALMIKDGLKRCNFNKSRLAKELGVSRASLIMKVEKYGLDKRKKAAGE